jgi:flagellar assembly protein FliH
MEEIRKLTYVSRSAEARLGNGSPAGSGLYLGELPPFLPKSDAAKQPKTINDIRFEARVIELQREREESERRHREALIEERKRSADELTAALNKQKEKLMQEYAGSVQAAIDEFQRKQDQYFAEAEAAVVRLSLGIAARVLHREAQLDPLMLRGPVRVALEEAQQNAACVLEVSATEADDWRRWLMNDDMLARIQIRSKEDTPAGFCRLEIGASSTDLSVHAQLAEIERGFFDLLQSRPRVMSNEARFER